LEDENFEAAIHAGEEVARWGCSADADFYLLRPCSLPVAEAERVLGCGGVSSLGGGSVKAEEEIFHKLGGGVLGLSGGLAVVVFVESHPTPEYKTHPAIAASAVALLVVLRRLCRLVDSYIQLHTHRVIPASLVKIVCSYLVPGGDVPADVLLSPCLELMHSGRRALLTALREDGSFRYVRYDRGAYPGFGGISVHLTSGRERAGRKSGVWVTSLKSRNTPAFALLEKTWAIQFTMDPVNLESRPRRGCESGAQLWQLSGVAGEVAGVGAGSGGVCGAGAGGGGGTGVGAGSGGAGGAGAGGGGGTGVGAACWYTGGL
jgi:hypothetical protein